MPTTSAAGTFARIERAKYLYTAEAMGVRPTARFVRLHSTDPGVDGSVGEITGSAYAAQAVSFTRTTNQVVNAAAITFPAVITAGYTVAWYSVFDAATAGNMLVRCALAVPKTLAVGDAASFGVGEIIITET